MTNWTYAVIPGWGEVCFQQLRRERDTDRFIFAEKLTRLVFTQSGAGFQKHPLYQAGLVHDPIRIDPAHIAVRSICHDPATAKLNEVWGDVKAATAADVQAEIRKGMHRPRILEDGMLG